MGTKLNHRRNMVLAAVSAPRISEHSGGFKWAAKVELDGKFYALKRGGAATSAATNGIGGSSSFTHFHPITGCNGQDDLMFEVAMQEARVGLPPSLMNKYVAWAMLDDGLYALQPWLDGTYRITTPNIEWQAQRLEGRLSRYRSRNQLSQETDVISGVFHDSLCLRNAGFPARGSSLFTIGDGWFLSTGINPTLPIVARSLLCNLLH